MFKPLIDSYSAVLKKFKGKDIGATINEEVNIERLKTMYDGYDGDRVIEIRFIDIIIPKLIQNKSPEMAYK